MAHASAGVAAVLGLLASVDLEGGLRKGNRLRPRANTEGFRVQLRSVARDFQQLGAWRREQLAFRSTTYRRQAPAGTRLARICPRGLSRDHRCAFRPPTRLEAADDSCAPLTLGIRP